jgi:GMP synthase (glutamine-hydrolysing)
MTLIDFSAHHAGSQRKAGKEEAPRDVLVVVHRRETNPGNVGRWLRDNGYRLDIRCPRFGDPLPETLENHTGAIVFGGPMSANDGDDYIRREIDWLAVPLREGKPYFGICLGAQMLAKHLGSTVGFHPEGLVEVGYYPIRPTDAGRALLPWPDHVYHWHCEGFGLPHGAECMATGAAFENQAFRYGNAYGVQFHPEITLAMIHCWTVAAAHRLAHPGARHRRDHIGGHDVHAAPVKAWLGQFMALWLAQRPAVQAVVTAYQKGKSPPPSGFSLAAGVAASPAL